MLTKGRYLIINIKVEKKIRIWLPIPLFILEEFLWQVVEVLDLVGWRIKNFKKYRGMIPVFMKVFDCLAEGGKYDLVDVEVREVRVNIKVR